MTDAARNPDDYCYRHPDRQSFVLCERCGRTICLECQNHVGGRVLCPDDAKSSNVTMMPVNARPPKPKRVRRDPAERIITDSTPVLTYSIAAVSLLVSIVAGVSGIGYSVQAFTIYQARAFAPWQLVLAPLVNPSILGLIFNLFAFVIFGRYFERLVTRRQMIAVLLIGSFAGEAFTLLLGGLSCAGLSMPTVAMAAALFLIQRARGRTDLILLGILVFDIVIAIIADGQWQAIIGSIAAGALLGYLFSHTERLKEGRPQNTVLVVLGAVLFLVAATGAFTFGGAAI